MAWDSVDAAGGALLRSDGAEATAMMGWIYRPGSEPFAAAAPGSLAEVLPGWASAFGRDSIRVPGAPLSDPPQTKPRAALVFNGVGILVLVGGLAARSAPAALGAFFVLAVVDWYAFWWWVRTPPPMSYVVRSGVGTPPRAVLARADDLIAYEREVGHVVWVEATTAAGVFFRVRASRWSRWVPYWVRAGRDGSVVVMRLVATSPTGDSGIWVSQR